MRFVPILGALLALITPLFAQDTSCEPGAAKAWHFATREGSVCISLFAYPPKPDLVLALKPEGAAQLPAAEVGDILRRVLADMVKSGHEPKNLNALNIPLQGTAYRDGIERAVFKSGKWKGCERRKYCWQAEPVAEKYLKSVDAFKELDALLGQYGLRRGRKVHFFVEAMGAGMISGRFSCDGIIFVYLQRE